jgi:hypothetical protein
MQQSSGEFNWFLGFSWSMKGVLTFFLTLIFVVCQGRLLFFWRISDDEDDGQTNEKSNVMNQTALPSKLRLYLRFKSSFYFDHRQRRWLTRSNKGWVRDRNESFSLYCQESKERDAKETEERHLLDKLRDFSKRVSKADDIKSLVQRRDILDQNQ